MQLCWSLYCKAAVQQQDFAPSQIYLQAGNCAVISMSNNSPEINMLADHVRRKRGEEEGPEVPHTLIVVCIPERCPRHMNHQLCGKTCIIKLPFN